MVKVTVDGVDKDGKAEHNEWTGKFDGKDYKVVGQSVADMRSYTKVDDNTLNMVVKKDGKVIGTGKIAVSADGKSRTVTTGPDGLAGDGRDERRCGVRQAVDRAEFRSWGGVHPRPFSFVPDHRNGSENVFTRNTAICWRLAGFVGQ